MTADRKPLSSYWTPRYWPYWLAIGLIRLFCLLPHGGALAAGRAMGHLAYRVGGRRRAIARRNLELCFPAMSDHELDALTRKHFAALGMSFIEAGLGRWASDAHLASITKIDGIEHLQTAIANGKGVILLTAHFTTMEISGRVLALNSPPFDVVHRKSSNHFIEELQRSGRERAAAVVIEKGDVRKMVRSLRAGRPVWYAPDQSYNLKGAAPVKFFGIPALQTTATSSIARLGKAVVIPYLPQRLGDGTYLMTLLRPFEEFPGDDPIADTRRYSTMIENHVRLCPEQYFWVHRKFKNLPEPYPDYYSDLAALK